MSKRPVNPPLDRRAAVFAEMNAFDVPAPALDYTDANLPRSAAPARPALSCDEAIDLFGAHLAQELTAEETRRFVDHIQHCGPCHDKLLAFELYLYITAEEFDSEDDEAERNRNEDVVPR